MSTATPPTISASAAKRTAVPSNLPETIRVYNTLSKKKEPLETVVPGKVGIYLCGPTVYDKAHIGHMVGPVIFDAIKRYLAYSGYEVKWVVNITDVDDKLINKANERQISMAQVAEENTADYLHNLAALGVDQIDQMPKATEHMEEIIGFVEQLIERGFAYESEGDVFFDVAKDSHYGKLSNRTTDAQQGEGGGAAARKRSVSDFALWKAAKPGEPCWDSPWGQGRPGWHIECSAMSRVLLGETFDFHGGGLDLVFPHHENEIAQSECCHGKPMARYWLHNGLMRADTSAGKVGGRGDRDKGGGEADDAGGKISRSKGGSTGASALAGLIERQGGERIRFFLLRTHYRSTIMFSEAAIEEAAAGLDTFYRFFERYQRITGTSFYDLHPQWQRSAGDALADGSELAAEVAKHRQAYLTKMDDDFNTGGATAELFELVRVLNRFAEQQNLEDSPSRKAADVEAFTRGVAVLRELGGVLGLFRQAPQSAAAGGDQLTGKLLDLFIELRQMCRAEKNFAMSDTIRDRLSELGITLEDRKEGTIWRIE